MFDLLVADDDIRPQIDSQAPEADSRAEVLRLTCGSREALRRAAP